MQALSDKQLLPSRCIELFGENAVLGKLSLARGGGEGEVRTSTLASPRPGQAAASLPLPASSLAKEKVASLSRPVRRQCGSQDTACPVPRGELRDPGRTRSAAALSGVKVMEEDFFFFFFFAAKAERKDGALINEWVERDRLALPDCAEVRGGRDSRSAAVGEGPGLTAARGSRSLINLV